jgi:hypothetical protein
MRYWVYITNKKDDHLSGIHPFNAKNMYDAKRYVRSRFFATWLIVSEIHKG